MIIRFTINPACPVPLTVFTDGIHISFATSVRETVAVTNPETGIVLPAMFTDPLPNCVNAVSVPAVCKLY